MAMQFSWFFRLCRKSPGKGVLFRKDLGDLVHSYSTAGKLNG